MSVRRIPKNYRNLTGLASTTKAEDAFFESTLERDFITLLEFDDRVQCFDVQPVCIRWVDSEGKRRTYTPDVLVKYHDGLCSFSSSDMTLCEVKYRSDIKNNWSVLKPKFKAAIRYANERGWRFKLFTEVEIRTVYMENARFLLGYLNQELDEAHEGLLLARLDSMREATIEQLIKSVFNDKWFQAELIQSLWHLVADRRILTDFNIPLTMSSRVWLER